MNRYFVFSGLKFYPSGGMADCTMQFSMQSDLDAAQHAVDTLMPDGPDWIEVYRLGEFEMVRVFTVGQREWEGK